MKKWNVVARFFKNPDPRWLDDFISDPEFRFCKIVAAREDDWHVSRRRTTTAQWMGLLSYSWRAFDNEPSGIITCFPQLAMTVAVIKRLTFRHTQIVAHNFNLGSLPGGLRRAMARFAARQIDAFIVHSPTEIVPYARYLGVAERRIHFVPLQRGEIPEPRREETAAPYLLAMGSAHRDYESLIAAVEQLGLRTVIVTREDIITRLPKPHCVEFHHGFSEEDCIRLLAGARLSVIPISNLETASGQVTIVNSMMLGVAVIATRCPGSEGYIEEGETGLLVAPFDTEGMKCAIQRLWSDSATRETLARRGKLYAQDHFNDPVAAEALRKILASLG